MLKQLLIIMAWFTLIGGLLLLTHYSTNTHHCYDSTHQTCDGVCECDGLGCSKDKPLWKKF
jgi:hypothetical protein